MKIISEYPVPEPRRHRYVVEVKRASGWRFERDFRTRFFAENHAESMASLGASPRRVIDTRPDA